MVKASGASKTSKAITGHEVVELRLTSDQVSFIVSGLKDRAQALCPLIDDAETDELERDYRKIRLENLALARELEATMLQQL